MTDHAADAHEHLAADDIVERLRDTPLFGGLADAELRQLVEMGEIADLERGATLIVEGDPADALYVVLAGELDVSKRSGGVDVPLARVGPGSLQGEIAALEGGRRLATVRAATEAEVLRIPVSAVRALLAAGPDVSLAVIRTAVGRLRAMEAALREREKLAALGTLAAGLAHELNNPAAAALRSAQALRRAVARAEERPRPTPPPRPPGDATPPRTALERADRIDAVARLTGDDRSAAALVEAGWTAEALAGEASEAIPWLAADAEVHALLDELAMAIGRISDIVGAVKGYAYLDQAPVQRVDLRTGIEQTLVILRHRLKAGVEVEVDLADDLPEVEAYGSELNQVWTNLIDNAIDAMGGTGRIRIAARPEEDGTAVRVEVCDDGPGVPDAIRDRLFEPFFTTKAGGMGMGLAVSRTIVEAHGGRLWAENNAGGGATFRFTIPAVEGGPR